LYFWRSSAGGYADVRGNAIGLPAVDEMRRVTEFAHDGQPVAAMVHDSALADDPDVLEAAGGAVRLAIENSRLNADLAVSIGELEASRRRVALAADEERRRIERDLHDGAQQHLIGLRIKLDMLEGLATDAPASLAEGIADATSRIDDALEQIRNLAKGIYPSVLSDLGLVPALAAVARDLPLEVSLRTQLSRRYAREVETAVYFCCLEALQNVVKHCGSGTKVELQLLERSEGLEFVVTDKGCGFDQDPVATTHGITGMRDRVEAVGGTLMITSIPGKGTTVTGRVPGSPP